MTSFRSNGQSGLIIAIPAPILLWLARGVLALRPFFLPVRLWLLMCFWFLLLMLNWLSWLRVILMRLLFWKCRLENFLLWARGSRRILLMRFGVLDILLPDASLFRYSLLLRMCMLGRLHFPIILARYRVTRMKQIMLLLKLLLLLHLLRIPTP